MKVHIKTSDFYSWFRSDLKIGGTDPSKSLFEILDEGYCTLKFDKNAKWSLTLKDYEWCLIFQRYLESKNLICHVGANLWGSRFVYPYIGQEAQPRFDLTLLVKMNGESLLDSIGIEQ